MSVLRLARRPAPQIGPNLTVMDAIKSMVEQQAGAVAVTENGKLLGIFSERDVIKKIVLTEKDAKKVKVRDIMTAEVKVTRPEAAVSDAITQMGKYRIRHLPVVSETGELLGMLSQRYLLHDRIDDVMTQLIGLDNYMAADGPGG